MGLSITGCVFQENFPPAVPRGVLLSLEAGESIIRKVAAKDEELVSFRGLSRTEIVEGGSKVAFRQIIAFNRPGSLRIETLPVVGALTLNLFVAHGGVAKFIDTESKRVITGTAENSFFRPLYHLPTGESEVMSLFTGRIPQRYLSANDLLVYSGKDSYTIVKGDNTFRWKVDSESLLLKEAEIREQFRDQLVLRITFGDPLEAESPGIADQNAITQKLDKSNQLPRIPSSFEIESVKDGFKLKGEYQQIKVNQVLSEDKFMVQVPDGYKVEAK